MINAQQACRVNDEWFTPPSIVELVRETLGEIHWDLSSCSAANECVKSDRFFSKDLPFEKWHQDYQWQDGFFVNPPFSLCKVFSEIIVSQSGLRGIALTNANTDSMWWQRLAGSADAIMLLTPRVGFISPDTGKPVKGNPKGQSLFFWGCETDVFELSELNGIVLVKRSL